MKIIAGKHKNTIIPTYKHFKYRPSTNKFRAALFSIISSGIYINQPLVKNANILDVFAGTGSLAFEGLSRGANSITLLDKNEHYLNMSKNFARAIGDETKVHIILANAMSLPSNNKQQYNLVFIDPPYNNNLWIRSLDNLIKHQWLKHEAIIAVEMAANKKYLLTTNLKLIKEKVYGNSKLLILQYFM